MDLFAQSQPPDRRQNGVWFTKDTVTSTMSSWCTSGQAARLELNTSGKVNPDLHHSQDCMSKPNLKHRGKNIALWSPAYWDMLLFWICSIARNSLSDLPPSLGWSMTCLHWTDSKAQLTSSEISWLQVMWQGLDSQSYTGYTFSDK